MAYHEMPHPEMPDPKMPYHPIMSDLTMSYLGNDNNISTLLPRMDY